MFIPKRRPTIIIMVLFLSCATTFAMISFGHVIADDDNVIKRLQRDKQIPTFPIVSTFESEQNNFLNQLLTHETVQSNSDTSINLSVQIGKNDLKIIARSPLKEDSILDSDALATLYAFIIGYNSSHGTELAKTWPIWNMKTPTSFDSTLKKYLAHPFLLDRSISLEHKYLMLPIDAKDHKDGTSVVERYCTIFSYLLSSFYNSHLIISPYNKDLEGPVETENRTFVTSVAKQLLLKNSNRPELCTWEHDCKNLVIKTFNKYGRGQNILKDLVSKHSEIKNYIAELES